MAGTLKANRPLPAEPVEEDAYGDAGFDDHEFSDGEDQEDYVNSTIEENPEEELSDGKDLEPAATNPTMVCDKVPTLPQRQAPQRQAPQRQAPQRQAPQRRHPTPSESDEEYVEPKIQQDSYVDMLELQEPYEIVNKSVLRPALPAPMQPQEESIALEQGTGTLVQERKNGSQRRSVQQADPSTPSSANRSLPSLPPGGSDTTKRSLPSRPLPNVPNSDAKNLSIYPWYFGDMERHKAITKIEALHKDGAYLVRSSTRDANNPYTLNVFYKSKVWNLHIRIRPDKKYAIGALKHDEECFADVPELIEYHNLHSIILLGPDGGETRLIKHPKK